MSDVFAGSILGFNSDDTTWGTFQAAVAWMPPLEVDHGEAHTVVDVATMGRPAAAGYYHEESVVEQIQALPRLKHHFGYQAGFIGYLLEHLMGASASAGTSPTTHTYTLGNKPTLGASITFSRGVRATEKMAGCRAVSWTLNQDNGTAAEPHLTVESNWIGKSTGGEESYVTPTYPPTLNSRRAKASQQTAFTFNSVNYISSGEIVSWSLTVERGIESAPSVGSKYTQDPVQTGPIMVTVRATVRLASATLYAAHRAQTVSDITITYAGTGTDALRITARNARISEYSSPARAGGNTPEATIVWKCYGDSADSPLTIEVDNSATDDRAN